MKCKYCLLLLPLFLSLSALTAAQSFYYYCDFEHPNDTTGWRFDKNKISTDKSSFVIGKAIHRIGARSLYVSSDGGATAGYTSSANGYSIVAYRKFTLSAGLYDLAFDLRIVGDGRSDNDVLRVAYFPTTRADGTAQLPPTAAMGQLFPKLVTDNPFIDNYRRQVFSGMSWNKIQGTLNIPQDGDYYLAFYFKENGGVIRLSTLVLVLIMFKLLLSKPLTIAPLSLPMSLL